MFKKIINCLLFIIIFCLSSCSFSDKKSEEELLNTYLSSIEEIPSSYEYSMLEDLYISQDIMDKTSKEIADYIIKKSTISVPNIQGNKATIIIKSKNIYDYMNGNSFLNDYILESKNINKSNISIQEYGNFVYDFFKQKIDSKDVIVTSQRISISFIKNKNEYKLDKESEKLFFDTILCKDKILENEIIEKVKPNNFLDMKFEISSNNKTTESDIDKPRDKEYNVNDEIFIKNNKYKIPEDIEYQSIPDTNDTTRTSRRNAIKIGEVATFDGNGLGLKQQDYKLNMFINNVYTGDKAKELLKNNNEKYNNDSNYIVFFLTLKLKNNNTGKETVVISFTDFDLIDYESTQYSYFYLNNMKQFDAITKDESTTGYIAFEYDNSETINLAFKEYLPNTIWFEIN